MAAKGFRGAGMAREFPTLAHIIAMGGNQDETRGHPGIPIIRNRHPDSAPSSWRHHYVYGVAAAVGCARMARESPALAHISIHEEEGREYSSSSSFVVVVFGGRGIPWRKDGTRISRVGTYNSRTRICFLSSSSSGL